MKEIFIKQISERSTVAMRKEDFGMKGQVTIFIIIGILLLLFIGAIIFMRQARVTKPLEEAVRLSLSEIPTAARPVREFVQNCIEQIAEEGLRAIGDHGGYITVEDIRARIVPNDPTESDAVVFSPGSDLVIPYWWYLKSPNTCTGTCQFATKRPNLYKTQGEPSIEGQLDQYMNENLPLCLDNFRALQEFTVTPRGSIETNTSVTTNSLAFYVKYPLVAQKAGESYTITDYFVEIPLNLREIYELATEITNLEAEHKYLENDVKNLLTAFSRLDTDALPPFTGVELGLGGGKYWVKQDVQEKVKAMLAAYIPVLQVWGTKNYQWIQAPTGTRDVELFELTYNRQQLVPVSQRHPDVSASFVYLDWWQPYFDLNCRGQVCGPESFMNTWGFTFGLQRYNFAYDVSFPVMVELSNPTAFEGRNGGFSFKFMLEANVRNNDPLQTVFEPLKVVSAVEPGSLLCDIGQRNSAPVTIKIIDGRTRKQVEADIVYQCGSESCGIGTAVGGEITTPFPVCFGGILGVTKPDYWPTYVPLSTNLHEAKNVAVVLEPIRSIDVEVKRLLLKKSGNTWVLDAANPVPHGAKDQTIVSMQRKGTPYDYPFTTIAEVFGDQFSTEQDFSQDVPIIPGTYDVSINTVSYEDIIIPPDRRCYGGGGLVGKRKCVNVPKEPIEFGPSKPFPVGGATFEWTVSAEDLDRARTITFFTIYIAEAQLPESERKIEDLEEIAKINEYSQAYNTFLVPVIS